MRSNYEKDVMQREVIEQLIAERITFSPSRHKILPIAFKL